MWKSDVIQTALHWVFSVQCCPKSITTLLNRIVSCAMLSGAFWTTLHKVFYLCNVVPRVLSQYWTIFFLCNVVWSLLDNTAKGFFSYFVQRCPKKIKTTRKNIFLVQCCLQPQGQYYIGFFLWNIVPKVLRKHCTGFFPVQCYLQPLGQHCTRFLPVQCCPKSIKTTLNKIIPVQCCLEAVGQHCTRLLPVECCPRRIKTILNRTFSCAMLSGASRTTLLRVFTCAMLS